MRGGMGGVGNEWARVSTHSCQDLCCRTLSMQLSEGGIRYQLPTLAPYCELAHLNHHSPSGSKHFEMLPCHYIPHSTHPSRDHDHGAMDACRCRWSGAASGVLQHALQGTCSAEITSHRCDSAAREEVAALAAAYCRRGRCPGIGGVINSGGVLSDAVLAAQTAGGQHFIVWSRICFCMKESMSPV